MGDVVAVADVGQFQAVEAGVLAHGEQVGHDLRAMASDRALTTGWSRSRPGRPACRRRCARSGNRRSATARGRCRGWAHIAAELGIVLGHEDGPAAEVAHGDSKDTRVRVEAFSKMRMQVLPASRSLVVVGGLHGGGPVEDAGGLVAAEIEDGQKTSRGIAISFRSDFPELVKK